MKKCTALMLTFLLVFSLSACAGNSADISDYIIEDNGYQRLVLPQSKDKVHIEEEIIELLDDVNIELLKEAEKSIITKVKRYADEPYFYLEVSEDGYLYLCAEVLVDIDPSSAPSNGCSDHEHKFFKERIMQ